MFSSLQCCTLEVNHWRYRLPTTPHPCQSTSCYTESQVYTRPLPVYTRSSIHKARYIPDPCQSILAMLFRKPGIYQTLPVYTRSAIQKVRYIPDPASLYQICYTEYNYLTPVQCSGVKGKISTDLEELFISHRIKSHPYIYLYI